MSGIHRSEDLHAIAQPERGDAARNRALLLDAARRLVAKRGADGFTMDDVATAAGVGKGTLFRRFGSRAGLMMVLLDEDERACQQAFLCGPPPLGPDAAPLDRLIAFGRERICFVHAHRELLTQANRDPRTRYGGAASAHRAHVRMLLQAAHTTGDLDVQTDALLALLDVDYVERQLNDCGHTRQTLGDAWESLARKLCGE
ncbi:TetR/AcrR family transcriptional regulator [Mycobacterium simiae]|uniref:TetR/AcrR family transcriptional regulator n=1 Tax=Mycobacterium simiae TaxID=1784 RepID=A0A5B1BQH8_MYCSI|nr:TetR/AcrR family transcriptional regulator [Mycobacterium simiae]KAA1250947.1 TetR/AcrR family transcriptional regulator [Mycobacterium simiae]